MGAIESTAGSSLPPSGTPATTQNEPIVVPSTTTPSPTPSLAVARSTGNIDDYSLDESKQVGSGADASVVTALHVPSRRRVALKLIDKSKRRADQLERSRFEGHIMADVLDHPNIVKAFPLVETEEAIIIPMELATFGDLLDHVNHRHGFPEPEARSIFRQIALGLAHAHSKNIIHGDVKLENIVIFPPTKDSVRQGDFTRRFAICDWGYARLSNGEPLLRKAFGSMLYSAPEVITGKGHFGTATDIWGLGVILYALVYATLPFGGKDLRTHIANAVYQFPSDVPVSLSCKDLITRILKPRPEDRLEMSQILAHPWCAVSPMHPKPIHVSVSNCTPLPSLSSSTVSAASSNSVNGPLDCSSRDAGESTIVVAKLPENDQPATAEAPPSVDSLSQTSSPLPPPVDTAPAVRSTKRLSQDDGVVQP